MVSNVYTTWLMHYHFYTHRAGAHGAYRLKWNTHRNLKQCNTHTFTVILKGKTKKLKQTHTRTRQHKPKTEKYGTDAW